MAIKFLQKFIKGMSKAFEEKPEIEADDFELEHFLFYHGLAGTTPLNQRKFKDVKADINLAFNNQSSVQLAVALKLPPLWWEEKLRVIFQEQSVQTAIDLIYPDLLMHENWQVRANSSNMLAFIKATEQIDALIESIDDTASNTKAAFVHQIAALAKLAHPNQSAGTEQTLFKYLKSADPWMRVDATNAACHYRQEKASELEPLLESICEPHLLSDYCAVVASRTIKPLSLLENSPSNIAIAAGASMISGLLHAAQGTFGPDCLKDAELKKCLDAMVQMACKPDFENKPFYSTMLSAIWHLSRYLNVDGSRKEVDFAAPQLRSQISKKVTDNTNLHEQYNAIILAGELKITEAVDGLLSLLHKDFKYVDEIIDALGKIGDIRAAKPFLTMSAELVDLEDRTTKGISTQPLLQDHQNEIKTYWRILQNLENLPNKEVLEFLSKQSKDVAPDKRLAALNSMIRVKSALVDAPLAPVAERLGVLLSDPSLEVRTKAVAGIGELKIKEEIQRLAQLTSAKEVSFQRQVFETLSELSSAGNKAEVEAALRQKLKSVMDPHLSRKLTSLIDSLTNA